MDLVLSITVTSNEHGVTTHSYCDQVPPLHGLAMVVLAKKGLEKIEEDLFQRSKRKDETVGIIINNEGNKGEVENEKNNG